MEKYTTKKTSTKPISTLKKPFSKKGKVTKQVVYYSIFVTLWAALSIVASQYLVSFIMGIILGDNFSKPFWTLVFYVISFGLALVLVIMLSPRLWVTFARSHTSKKQGGKITKVASDEKALLDVKNNPLASDATELGVGSFPTFVDIGLAPIGYVIYMIVASVILNLLSIFTWFDANQAQDVGFNSYYFITTADRMMAMIAIVFVAPIAEELIMRGWLYGKLRQRLNIGVSILITSFIFALLHGQLNVGVTVFVLSIVLCSLREVTGTVWSSMLLHILTNGISFYLVYVAGI